MVASEGRPGRRVAIVFRDGPDHPLPDRLAPMADALTAAGLDVEAVPYDDDPAGAVLLQLRHVDGALVWVDPLSDHGDRTRLDLLLREAAAEGVWLGAHPDVIDRLGTKDVLVATRNLPWGSDTHRYDTPGQLRAELPLRLATDRARVLKADRGNGGRTVWKVRLPDTHPAGQPPVEADTVLVQHARVRDGSAEAITLEALLDRLAAAFRTRDSTGHLVDQEFVPGISRGIVRCYLVGGHAVGFARQYPPGVLATGPLEVDLASLTPAEDVMGLLSAKTMYPADEPALAGLRLELEQVWLPAATQALGVPVEELPALWDVDLLVAEARADGTTRFVLCEVNASSVIPYPDSAPRRVADHTVRALRGGR